MATVTNNLLIETDAPEYFRCTTHFEDMFKRLRCRQDLFDVVLIIGNSGRRISAHRLILIASSDYFSALLSGSMRESKEREVTINEVDGDSLENLVNFCYTGNLELREDNVEALIITANYLQFLEITEYCCEFLQRHLKPSNCIPVGFLAEQLNLEALLHNTKKFICENFEEISNGSNLFLLTAKQLTELMASDNLYVPSEEFVFRVVMKWIEYDPKDRREHFTELLSQVRLPLLPHTFLTEEVEPLCNTIESLKLVMNARKCHLMPRGDPSTPYRTGFKDLLCFCKSTNEANEILGIASFNVRSRVWTIWNTPLDFRNQFAVALIDDNLILVGGMPFTIPVNTVESLNLNRMASSEIAPLKTDRSGHAVAVLNGSIYAIGGCNEYFYLSSVERWDPVNQAWSFVAPMENVRYFPGAAVINDLLYVSGGDIGFEHSELVECYDPIELIWKSMAPMKVGRSTHCLAPYKGYLFAIGGYTGEYAEECDDQNFENEDIPTERYDPHTDTWTTISCTPNISGYTRCTSVGPDLFIYNNSNIYMISSDVSCDNLQLLMLSTLPDTMGPCKDLVAIPYAFSPSEIWIKNIES